jgi:hypothetical protein
MKVQQMPWASTSGHFSLYERKKMVPIMNQKRGKHFGFICIFYQGNNRVDFE